MKKWTIGLIAVLTILILVPSQTGFGINPSLVMDSTRTAQSSQANTLLIRLDEIKAMDKSNLSVVERKQLREEVRSIKSQLKAIGGGVYLSVGALLIIILLLILIL